MHHLSVALITFACVFCSALLGLYLRTLLPQHHLDDDSIGVVKLATGLIATMAALVLGLLISSAKSSLDMVDASVTRDAANVVLLDRVLVRYGPQTQEIRDMLKQIVARAAGQIASGDPAQLKALQGTEALERAEYLERKLESLSPQNDAQRRLQARAIEMVNDAIAVREMGVLQAAGSTPTALLVTLVLWLCIIFGAFGLFTPANTTVVIALFLGALSTSIAIFLILEMNTPLDGMVTVSMSPMHQALAVLGR
ncbi:DUF4239 domain-containing protein [Paraburkholderia phymatum]|uniref:DUF4239 domain-containing protein n=1 Tax=Paraburkholderia phymatum (strain DSM 17167 / CIP 108236 / LMG 21445 / STM815) TaxID=391038 RepID=B2JWQ2_PARP8|nr:DUF4239 domain-containing protein [Paraburkholderia phymatum]ACC75379.1 conserved hypothetical protein [Paraburkholderia phymatum STM815]